MLRSCLVRWWCSGGASAARGWRLVGNSAAIGKKAALLGRELRQELLPGSLFLQPTMHSAPPRLQACATPHGTLILIACHADQ